MTEAAAKPRKTKTLADWKAEALSLQVDLDKQQAVLEKLRDKERAVVHANHAGHDLIDHLRELLATVYTSFAFPFLPRKVRDAIKQQMG